MSSPSQNQAITRPVITVPPADVPGSPDGLSSPCECLAQDVR